ncbi:MAG: LCP family protein [Actinobacteria bacterium]|nr:LCP family protein [Actinomycetota bacterium]
MRKGNKAKGRAGKAILAVALATAAACAVLLVDPWGWFDASPEAAVEVGAFPGVEAPSTLPPAEPLSTTPFNVLILGLDHGAGRSQQGNERSDVMMVAHVDEARGKACLLSIPRDSYVAVPGHGTRKINEAYPLGGPELAAETVEMLTGLDIRNYVVMDFDEFAWLVDLFGGVQVTLDEAIMDPKLGIIPAGSQVLDGQQALIMARSRDYPEGDLERARQQQRLVIQALYKGKALAGGPGAAWFLSVALERLETDLTRDEVIRLAREFAAFPVVDVQGGVLPGRNGATGGASVYFVDQQGTRALVDSIENSCSIPQEFR